MSIIFLIVRLLALFLFQDSVFWSNHRHQPVGLPVSTTMWTKIFNHHHGRLQASYLLLLLFPLTCHGDVLFSKLPRTLVVSASTAEGKDIKTGEDIVTITWGLNQRVAKGIDDSYCEVKLKLCYAPISQHDRPWRQTNDNLSKDKTCQFTIAHKNYTRNMNQTFVVGTLETDVPSAVYFVRVYAYDASGNEVAYGQTTDHEKKTIIFKVEAISGRTLSIDIAVICFSAFSLLSLVGFIFIERRRNRRPARNQRR